VLVVSSLVSFASAAVFRWLGEKKAFYVKNTDIMIMSLFTKNI